jgi:hypothetical protein
MSSAVRDTERLAQRQMDVVQRRNERELSRIQEGHQNLKAELMKTQDLELLDVKSAHQGAVNKEADRKERILAEMRSHLQQTRDFTDKELKALKDNALKEKNQTEVKLSTDRERLKNENELYLEDLDYRFNEASRKISRNGTEQVAEARARMGDLLAAEEQLHDQKLQQEANLFNERYAHQMRTNRKLTDELEDKFKKDRLTTNLRQQTEMNKLVGAHADHVEQRDGEYRKGLKEQDQFFEKKFAGQLKTHQKSLADLEAKNQKVVEDLKASLTKELTKTAARNGDPFYKFEALNPTLTQHPDRVEIRVAVPDHSKQDLQLTVNGKEAVVLFNRRYADASRTNDGVINKVNKVETFTTRLQTGSILDARSLKSSYDDGVMTYVIKKA